MKPPAPVTHTVWPETAEVSIGIASSGYMIKRVIFFCLGLHLNLEEKEKERIKLKEENVGLDESLG